ncbi:MAG: hypothetical protein ACRD0D_05140 [Acidimicrobiales bacterium]
MVGAAEAAGRDDAILGVTRWVSGVIVPVLADPLRRHPGAL